MKLLSKLQVIAKNGRSHLTLPITHNLIGNTRKTSFIVSYPRSGSTWLRSILTNILCPDAKGDPRIFNELMPGVSIRSIPLVREKLRQENALIKSHTRFRKDLGKVLYLVRDGRDALVSFYHYTTTRNNIAIPFADWFSLYRKGFYGVRWHDHVESWLKQGKEQKGERLLVLNFEGLKKETEVNVKKVLSFLEIDASDDEIEAAVYYASIEKSRKWEEMLIGRIDRPDASFYRDGSSRQWSNYFSQQDMETFLNLSASAMQLGGYV